MITAALVKRTGSCYDRPKMTATTSAPPTTENRLWHALQRVPPDEALLRALEAQLLSTLSIEAPCCDLRDQFGRTLPAQTLQHDHFQTIIQSVTSPSAEISGNTPQEIYAALVKDGRLIIFSSGSAESATALAKVYNQIGFSVEQWQPYYCAASQQAAASLSENRAQLWHDLTGHYVPLPWPRFLQPLDDYLRPYFDSELAHYAQDTDSEDADPGYDKLLFVLRKSDNNEEQPLPPATFPAAADPPEQPDDHATAATDDRAESSAETSAITKASESPLQHKNQALLPGILAGIALLFAFLAQSMMRSAPFETGAGLTALIIAFCALIGLHIFGRNPDPAQAAPRLSERLTNERITRITLGSFSLLLSLLAAARSGQALLAFLLWVLAIGLAAYVLIWPSDFTLPSLRRSSNSAENSALSRLFAFSSQAIAALTITFVALVLRYWKLTAHPWMLSGIEAQLGLEGIYVNDLFAVRWLTNPTLPMYFTKATVAIFGRTALALRILSPLVGAATVDATYLIGSRLWSKQVGLLAALMLALSYTHIHYSRLGMSNIWEPLILLLSLGSIAIAWQSGKPTDALMAGGFVGLSAYFYTPLHLLPIMLLALAGWAFIGRRLPQTNRPSWQPILIGAFFALIIATPQLRFFQQYPALFSERATLLGIESSGWVDNEIAVSGQSRSTIYLRQLWQATGSYNVLLDRDGSFNPSIPLVNSFIGISLLLGLGVAIIKSNQVRYLILLIGYLVTIIFAAALLVELPTSHRLLSALPLVFLLAASGLDWLTQKLVALAGQKERSYVKRLPQIVLLITLFFGLLNVAFYFTTYQNAHRFGDRNTEIAFSVGNYLAALDQDWTVYFVGAPQMYANAPTISYLSADFHNGFNLHDVTEGVEPPAAITRQSVYIFTPDHFDDFGRIQEQMPGGEVEMVDGFFANPLFIAYKLVQP